MNMMVMGDDASKECLDFLMTEQWLSSLLGWEINLIAFMVILFGTLIVAGAIYTLTRERR